MTRVASAAYNIAYAIMWNENEYKNTISDSEPSFLDFLCCRDMLVVGSTIIELQYPTCSDVSTTMLDSFSLSEFPLLRHFLQCYSIRLSSTQKNISWPERQGGLSGGTSGMFIRRCEKTHLSQRGVDLWDKWLSTLFVAIFKNSVF